MRSKYIGDKAFYRRVWAIALPIIAQQFVTNFVALLDNVMVGQLATAQISAVTIVNNNLMFIFNLCLYGGVSGAGIFATQYFGSGDYKGVRYAFRFKLLICLGLTLLGTLVFFFGCDPLVNLYLQGEGDPALAADTLQHSRQYMFVMLWGMLPFALSNTYASTLRECSHPTIPMIASIAATAVNLVFNYILIFGHFGAPAMGVTGAAVATVMSRYVELAIMVFWTHLNPEKNPYIRGVYRGLYIPGRLLKNITLKGLPLLLNEFIWALGMALLNQCYSTCGLEVVPAFSIATTVSNLTGVVFRSLGNTVGIIMGQKLGAGCPAAEVRDENRKLTALCIASGVVFAALSAAIAPIFPNMYNTTDTVRDLACGLILITAVFTPLQSYFFPIYFTLRAGGRAMVTLLFDSGSVWALCLPIAFLFTRFTAVPILGVYALVLATDIIKCFIGYFLVKDDGWIRNLTQ